MEQKGPKAQKNKKEYRRAHERKVREKSNTTNI